MAFCAAATFWAVAAVVPAPVTRAVSKSGFQGLKESYDYLALYNLKTNNKAEASSYVEKALALDPTDERAITIKKNLAPAAAPRRAAPAPKRK